jgi:hypothetical protein
MLQKTIQIHLLALAAGKVKEENFSQSQISSD